MTTRLRFQIYSGTYRYTWENGDEISSEFIGKLYNEKGDLYYYIELPEVGGKDIGIAHAVTITEKTTGESITLRFSAMTYAEMAFSQGATAKTKALVKTLAAYQKSLENWYNFINP
jgi:hypothetical protein